MKYNCESKRIAKFVDMKQILFYLVACMLEWPVFAVEKSFVTIPVACVRESPSHASQLVTQALMGTPVDVSDTDGEWAEVTLPDGYRGFISESSLADCGYCDWYSSKRAVVTLPEGIVLRDASGSMISPLPFGSVVVMTDSVSVTLPDGRNGVLTGADLRGLTDLDSWLKLPFAPDAAISATESWIGAPYLWGGMSSDAMDCSGLVRLAWMACGRILPRDAWQQALEGEEVLPEQIRRGDLVFFDRSGNGRVTHVAIATDSLGNLIHSSGRVRRGSLDPESPDYVTGEVIAIRRVEGKSYPYASERH